MNGNDYNGKPNGFEGDASRPIVSEETNPPKPVEAEHMQTNEPTAIPRAAPVTAEPGIGVNADPASIPVVNTAPAEPSMGYGMGPATIPVVNTTPARPGIDYGANLVATYPPAAPPVPPQGRGYGAGPGTVPNTRMTPPVSYGAQRPVKQKRIPTATVVIAVVCCLVLMLGCGFAGARIYEWYTASPVSSEEPSLADFPGISTSNSSDNSVSDDTGDPTEDSGSANPLTKVNPSGETLTLTELFAGADPAVVAISTETAGHNVFGNIVTLPAAGSGFIISDDGYIVTNNHVIEDATSISVLMYDGTTHPATLVGRDPQSDLAVLRINENGLSYLSWGDSTTLLVGEQVAAIGNPLGEFANTMTVGYISALNRDIYIDGNSRNMLQTDAAVNPGNSGGPLLNMQGQVIGIISAKSMGESVEGLGFAIPSSIAEGIVKLLINDGYVKGRAIMGVMVSTEQGEDGKVRVYVAEVNRGSAAEKAGVYVDDIILSANEIEVSSIEELKDVISALAPGDSLELKILRDGHALTLTVILDEYKPPEPETYNLPEPETHNLPEPETHTPDW